MKNRTMKKFVAVTVALSILTTMQFVMAQTATPTTSPYHTPIDTGVNLDSTLVIGAILYGVGVLFTSGAKVIGAKFGGFKLVK